MKTKIRATAPALLGLVAAAAACSDSSTAPESEFVNLNADLALFVADAVDEDLAVMGLSLPAGAAGSEVAEASAGIELQRTTTRSRTFFDASGAVMESYDALLTASITTATETTGSIVRSGLEQTLDRSRTTTVSGLAGEELERTWNGSGLEARTRVRTADEDEVRSYEFSGSSTVTEVVRSVDRVANPWPLSGTITRDVVVTIVNGPNGDETRSRTVTVTFDGTRFALMTIDGETFEVDLDARGRGRLRRAS